MMKRIYILYAALIIFPLLGLGWLWGHSYVEITVDNPGNGSNYTYTLKQQGSDKTTKYTAGPTIKKLVGRGSHDTTITDGQQSGFVVTHSGGFLTTSSYHISLSDEKSRSFVGNNPGVCSHYTGTLLMSYECHGLYRDALVHVPATNTTPTYTNKVKGAAVPGNIESIISTKEGTIVLVRGPSTSDDNHEVDSPLSLYRLRNDATINGSILVPSFTDKTPYTLEPYKDGFILYNSSFTQVYYFSSMIAAPVAINLSAPKTKGLTSFAFDTHQDNILTVYTNKSNADASDDKANAGSAGYQLFITNGSSSKKYGYTGSIDSISFCGQSICILDKGTLGVYSYTSGLKLRYKVSSVRALAALGEKALQVTDSGVINLDPQTGSGTIDYSFGNYKFCGLEPATSGYVLCIVDRKSNRLALYIDPAHTNTDSIDKKIDQLSNLIYVSKVSINGSKIFVIPNLGSTKYQPSIGIYDYDPATRTAAGTAINQKIDELGISRSAYQINVNLL
jgi:hypothetical protein